MCVIKSIKGGRRNKSAKRFAVCVRHDELVWAGESKCHMHGFKYASLGEMIETMHVQIVKGQVYNVSGFEKHKLVHSSYRSFKEYSVYDWYTPVDGWKSVSLADTSTVHLWYVNEYRRLVDEGQA